MSQPIDQQIDRALLLVGAAAPRHGIDQRLLARLENRVAAPVSSWRPLLTFAPPAAVLLTAALLLMIFHNALRSAVPATPQTIAQSVPQTNQIASQSIPSLLSLPAFRASAVIPSQPAAINSADVDPAYLPSFPAPEAPLTADERRLVQLAQRASSYDVAQLEAPPQLLERQQQSTVAEYIHRMLAPLVAAETFSPTPPVESDPSPPQSVPDSNSSTQ